MLIFNRQGLFGVNFAIPPLDLKMVLTRRNYTVGFVTVELS